MNGSFPTPRGAQSFNAFPTTSSGSSKRLHLASSSKEFINEQEDAERYANRRSIYRSPGTSSSPDLATLVRKARERGAVAPNPPYYLKEKTKTQPPPLPTHHDRPSTGSTTTRPRSSTSNTLSPSLTTSTSSSPFRLGRDKLNRGALTDVFPPEATASPSQSRDDASKASKSSVRQKTSALIGKMLGQNNTRAKTKPLSATLSHLPVLSNANERDAVRTPTDDTSNAIGPRFSSIVNSSAPPSAPQRKYGHPDETSLVFVDPASHSIIQDKLQDPSTIVTSKRRSLSVGDVDIKTPLVNSSSLVQRSINENPELADTTLHGIINDFKGQLSSLDPTNSTLLDLRDPTTSARRLVYRAETNGDDLSLDKSDPSDTSPFAHESTSLSEKHYKPKPDAGLNASETDAKPQEPSPAVPPRSSSLQMPPLSPVRPNNFRMNVSKELFTPSKVRHGTPTPTIRGSGRPQILHRPTASSSEPSLIPTHASSTHIGLQHGLAVNERIFKRFPSSNFSINGNETVDTESHGKELATKCWNEDANFLAREKIAEYLGGPGYINKIALRYYIAFFNFSGLRLDLAFRHLCSKLYLKAETQQVDRILEEFSKRYWECNPSTLYGSASVIHAVTYSIMLLNTDLHVADLATHMSRSQFVRNTMTAIQAQFPSTIAHDQDGNSNMSRNTLPEDTEMVGRSKRSDSIASWNSVSRDVVISLSPSPSINRSSEIGETGSTSTPGVDTKPINTSHLYNRTWENEMENLLKEMYGAIRAQQILQPANASATRLTASSSNPVVHRNRSLRVQPDRLTTLKRGSIRGLQSIITQSGASSNSSVDGRTSPSPSLATSAHEFHCSSSSFLTPSLGFASNLSNTIIREAREDDDHSVRSQGTTSTSISICDEELALLGPPWAKEGMLCRKQYWESTGKRAKDKSWLDVFVVIQRGELNMFTFGGGGSTAVSSNVIGGGNWLSNAHLVGTINLAHSLAHSLPPPGYNRQRPHCMVLTLANGGVYFFQAGTEELVNEWVSTCNYWAARTSKEPLAGGISNMEYGWNRVAEPHVYGRHHSEDESARDADRTDSISVRSSRSSRSRFGWREGVTTVRHGNSHCTDRIFINDWKVPLPPTVASTHDEETQLEALRKHVVYLKNDLERHNELREPMMALYQPRTATSLKAQTNWEKRSQYLLTEIVKYDSYIDSLQNAMALRLKKRGEKVLERALDGAVASEPGETAPGTSISKQRLP